MDHPSDDTAVRAAARALIEREMQDRLAIVDSLASTQETEDALLAQLAELRQQRRTDWAEAQRLGWSPRDLKRLKLRTPADAPRPSRRARASGQPAATSATAEAGNVTETEPQVPSATPSPEQPHPAPVGSV